MSRNGQHKRSPAAHSATIEIVFESDGNRISYPFDNSRTFSFRARNDGPSSSKCRLLASASSAKRSQAKGLSWVTFELPGPGLSADVLAVTTVGNNANANPIAIATMQFVLCMI